MVMNLQTLIADQGRKQSWISARLGIPESTLSQMIRGKQKFPLDQVRPLAELLGVPIEVVLAAATGKPKADDGASEG